jgi:predicted dehydrogenase
MKFCFFGMGSIGTRHAENVKTLLEHQGEHVEIHAFRSSFNAGNVIPAEKSFFSWEELEPPYDAIFISNPTSFHLETLLMTASLGRAFFVEKPSFHTAAIPAGLIAPFSEKITHVACPMRFHPIIKTLKEQMPGRVLAARILCSSYLPDWRKGRDYRKTYSARRDLGGGVALDLIHELDYARHLFGDPVKSVKITGTFSSLEITSDDVAAYILSYCDRLVEVHLDYFGRKKRRELELFCEEDTFVCDLLDNTIVALASNKTTSFPQVDFHREEIRYFINLTRSGGQSFNSLEDSVQTLRIAEGGETR